MLNDQWFWQQHLCSYYLSHQFTCLWTVRTGTGYEVAVQPLPDRSSQASPCRFPQEPGHVRGLKKLKNYLFHKSFLSKKRWPTTHLDRFLHVNVFALIPTLFRLIRMGVLTYILQSEFTNDHCWFKQIKVLGTFKISRHFSTGTVSSTW